MPITANDLLVPMAMVLIAGWMVMLLKVALVTVRVVLAVTPAKLADRVAVPAVKALAWPWLPLADDTVAMAGAELRHAAWVVMSCLVKSEKVPTAVSSTMVPGAALAPSGPMLMLVRAAPVTVTGVLLLMLLKLAVSVVLPAAMPVTVPCWPAAIDTVAVAVSALLHTAWLVTSR